MEINNLAKNENYLPEYKSTPEDIAITDLVQKQISLLTKEAIDISKFYKTIHAFFDYQDSIYFEESLLKIKNSLQNILPSIQQIASEKDRTFFYQRHLSFSNFIDKLHEKCDLLSIAKKKVEKRSVFEFFEKFPYYTRERSIDAPIELLFDEPSSDPLISESEFLLEVSNDLFELGCLQTIGLEEVSSVQTHIINLRNFLRELNPQIRLAWTSQPYFIEIQKLYKKRDRNHYNTDYNRLFLELNIILDSHSIKTKAKIQFSEEEKHLYRHTTRLIGAFKELQEAIVSIEERSYQVLKKLHSMPGSSKYNLQETLKTLDTSSKASIADICFSYPSKLKTVYKYKEILKELFEKSARKNLLLFKENSISKRLEFCDPSLLYQGHF